MGIVMLALIASVIGGVLVFLLSIAGPNPAAHAPAPEAGDPTSARLGPEGAWIAGLTNEEFGRLVGMIFEEMKFEVTPLEAELGEGVMLIANDPTPIKGSRIMVLGLPQVRTGIVDADVVRQIMEMVRGEEAGKGAVVTPAAFTDDARKAAENLPIDLIDGVQLLGLVKKHLAQVFAQQGL